jgi:ferrochelatase
LTQGPRTGVLLVQLGTPRSPSVADVRRYLREFLMDSRVVDLPVIPRWLLVNGVIAPFRAPRSARAYRAIWTPEGSPLLVHGRALAAALQERTGLPVALGMRYGDPTIGSALDSLGNVDRIVVVPLYPQYASASTGSAVEGVLRALATRVAIPAVTVTRPLAQYPAWADAVAEVTRPHLAGADTVIFSYHGLPERQVRATREGCLATPDCCDRTDALFGHCYRAQCLVSTRLLAQRLDLVRVETAFQSRLGRDAWLAPSLETTLSRVIAEGARNLLVVTPSFVADCLETLEEIGMRARDLAATKGATLTVAPCLDTSPVWVEALAGIVEAAASGA